MPAKNLNLHGNVPDHAPLALVIIDVINDLEFPGGEELFPFAHKMAHHIAALKKRTAAAGIPAIYVNDNFGRWRSDFNVQIDHCLRDACRGRPIVELLQPDEDDYFVLKPKHSGFFSTALDTLLAYLQVKTLILTGLTADNCVLFTANDAYMRDFHLLVPGDCVAACSVEETGRALRQMAKILKADVRPTSEWEQNEFARAPRKFNHA